MVHDEITSSEQINEVSRTLELLSHAHRRGVLYALQRDGRTTLTELVERITTWQNSDGTTTSRMDVQTMLVHSHLPKLADADVVEYDRPAETVAPGTEFDRLVDSLRHVDEPTFPVSRDPFGTESASETSR